MPSKSRAQHNFMEMVAHNPAAAKRVGVSQKVGKDFAEADKERNIKKLPKMKSKLDLKKGFTPGGPAK